MAIERPKYTVEVSEKPFEVRDYSPIIVATVHVDEDRSGAVNAGFRILAGYIFGDNQAQAKIAMTAPVTQSAGQTPALTAPVQQQALQGGSDIYFAMPSHYTLSTLPKPHDGRIRFVQQQGRRVASITFSGFWSDTNFQSHQDELLSFVRKHHLNATSAPIYAYYDAPWTPWFLRTNEVLIEISREPAFSE